MEDGFFSQLDGALVRALLLRTGLDQAAVFAVSSTLHIEHCSAAAQQLFGLGPMESLDPFLSESTRSILLGCMNTQSACSTEEEVDGTVYRVEMVPHRGGALLAYLHRDRASYDGSLRVIQNKSARYLSGLMSEVEQVEDAALAARLRQHCMRLYRLMTHSDCLHDPLLTEQLSLRYCNLAELCRKAAEQAAEHAPAHCAEIAVNLPEYCEVLLDARLIRTAVYNLLTNAMQVTPSDGRITVSLREEPHSVTITVADTGPGLDAARFDALLSGWCHTVSMQDYRALARDGTPMGLGLPLVNQIAQAHGGRLLLAPREGGGSVLLLSLGRLPGALADERLHAPTIIQDGYTAEEIEFSILE